MTEKMKRFITSNPTFNVGGKGKELLVEVIKLGLACTGQTSTKAITVTEHGIHLHWCQPDNLEKVKGVEVTHHIVNTLNSITPESAVDMLWDKVVENSERFLEKAQCHDDNRKFNVYSEEPVDISFQEEDANLHLPLPYSPYVTAWYEPYFDEDVSLELGWRVVSRPEQTPYTVSLVILPFLVEVGK